MDPLHRERIQRNIVRLSTQITNLNQLYSELLTYNVIFLNDIEKLKKSYPIPKEQAVEFFLRYTKRGPSAFGILINVLVKLGYADEANALLGVGPGGDGDENTNNESVSDRAVGVVTAMTRPSSASATVLPKKSSPVVQVRDRSHSAGNSPILRQRYSNVTMESLPPLNIKQQLRKAAIYNMGIHDAYPMMTNPRGYALIINNIDFIGNPSASRAGAEKDTENLTQLFEALHFKVTSYHNVKKSTVFKHIELFLDQFTIEDCCIVVIMSHGSEGYFLTSDAASSNSPNKNRVWIWKELLPRFNNRHCPKLRHKPKIFIIQSCRGDERDRGIRHRNQIDSAVSSLNEAGESGTTTGIHAAAASTVPQDEGIIVVEDDEDDERIPSFEDMIICQSTVPGFVSNRDIEKGTWYIESLCRVISANAHEMELTKMLKKVGLFMRTISSEYGEKQMCSFLEAGFHYDLYFNPGLFAQDEESIDS